MEKRWLIPWLLMALWAVNRVEAFSFSNVILQREEPSSFEDAPQENPAEDTMDTVSSHEEEGIGPHPGAPTINLAEAVSMALQNNFGIQATSDTVAAARIRESASRAQFFPRLTPRYQRSADDSTLALEGSQKLPLSGGALSASAVLRKLPSANITLSNSSEFRLSLTQPLLRGVGPTATNFDLTNSRRIRQAQERSYELARQRLAVEVTAAFYQIVKQRKLLEVSRQSMKRSQNLREASEARMKVGLVSKLDVFRAELQVAQAQESMVSFEAAAESELEQFRILLGLAPTDPMEPEAVTLSHLTDHDIEPLEILIARAFENRLELLESRDQVADGQRAAALARQNLLPQFDLNMTWTQLGIGSTFGNSFQPADRRFTLSFTTSYPLERSSDVANKAVAELDLQARRRSLKQREWEIEAEVRATVRSLSRIRKSMELQKKGVEFAEKQLRLATLRYQRGLTSNFDVVDAEGSWVAARTALVSLMTDYQVARIELLRAVGTLDVQKEFVP